MTLADDLLHRAHEAGDRLLEKKAEETLSELLDKLVERLPTEIEAGVDPHDAVLRRMGYDAVDRLRGHEREVVGLGRAALTVLLSYVASGEPDEVERQYLRLLAPPKNLVAAVLEAGAAAIAERQAREVLAERASALGKFLLEEVGPIAARYLLPLLLTARK